MKNPQLQLKYKTSSNNSFICHHCEKDSGISIEDCQGCEDPDSANIQCKHCKQSLIKEKNENEYEKGEIQAD